MNEVFEFIKDNMGKILLDVIGGLILAFLLAIIHYFKKRFSSKPITEPEKHAICLNTPQRSFDDNCIGRNKLLEKVLDKITDGKEALFKRKCVAITGEEGIGKSLFCYTLFQNY